MKVRELLEDAKVEIDEDLKKVIKGRIKQSIKEVNSGKKTLKKLEKAYEELLDTNIDDIEEEWKY